MPLLLIITSSPIRICYPNVSSLASCHEQGAKQIESPIKGSTHSLTECPFEVPAEFQDFCLFASGKEDSERVLIFRDKDTVVKSQQVYGSLWLADETFKICPLQFHQLYTIN